MKASLWWWIRGGGAVAGKQHQEFAEYNSDEFDSKLTELQNDDSVVIIEIFKGEAPQQAIQAQPMEAPQ